MNAVASGRKKASDALKEEFVEEATERVASWLERGGLERVWTTVKVIFVLLALLVFGAVVLVLEA